MRSITLSMKLIVSFVCIVVIMVVSNLLVKQFNSDAFKSADTALKQTVVVQKLWELKYTSLRQYVVHINVTTTRDTAKATTDYAKNEADRTAILKIIRDNNLTDTQTKFINEYRRRNGGDGRVAQ